MNVTRPLRTQGFLAPSAVSLFSPPPWTGAVQLLETEGRELSWLSMGADGQLLHQGGGAFLS